MSPPLICPRPLADCPRSFCICVLLVRFPPRLWCRRVLFAVVLWCVWLLLGHAGARGARPALGMSRMPAWAGAGVGVGDVEGAGIAGVGVGVDGVVVGVVAGGGISMQALWLPVVTCQGLVVVPVRLGRGGTCLATWYGRSVRPV